jgi:ATP-binding cassette subfamily F protein uup
VFEGAGRLAEYAGGYDDWFSQRGPVAPAQKEKDLKQEKPRQKRERPRILTFKEKKELEALPVLIEVLSRARSLFEILADRLLPP